MRKCKTLWYFHEICGIRRALIFGETVWRGVRLGWVCLWLGWGLLSPIPKSQGPGALVVGEKRLQGWGWASWPWVGSRWRNLREMSGQNSWKMLPMEPSVVTIMPSTRVCPQPESCEG